MKKTALLLMNEEGSVMVVVIIVMALLLLMGITATNISTVEMQILRNTIIQKQDFYITEGGVTEVAADVDYSGLPDRQCNDPGRTSCGDAGFYNITDIDTPVILTQSNGQASISNPTEAQVNNVTDTTWPVNHDGDGNEYAYRAYYKGQGPMPKGYGAGFGAYIFDITARKQSDSMLASMSITINEGYRKIGPKN